MNAGEYAQRLGVSKVQVTKYIQSGQITAKRVGRSYEIDPEVADQELKSNLALNNRSRKALNSLESGPLPVVPKPRTEPVNRPAAVEASAAAALPSGRPPAPTANYATARAVREQYAAMLLKLEYEQKQGQLVSKDQLRLKLSKLHLAVRDSLRTIPDRVAPVLAAEEDQSKIHSMLLKEIGQALEGLQGYDWN